MTEYQKPVPFPTQDTREYWEGCRRHELLIQRCRECGVFRFYPRPMCPDCNSLDSEWIKAGGKGRVYSWTVAVRQFHPAFEVPYIIAIVELEEGVRMTTNVINCKPEDLYVGMPVGVVFEDVTEEATIPKFEPIKD
ncbi:MAG: Zn-ribbon domain-containing OB-fold protein [Deltaproteobacteria bacterium]|nr:Zn-ribbon domain-containing OB-fold protein [Deltaproteobacteria bacterium]